VNSSSAPSLEAFLALSSAEVAKVAPATLVYAAGGTRRRAVFEGIEPWSDDFARWARERILSRIALIFRHGVRNLLVSVFTPDNFREVNRYRAQVFKNIHWFLTGSETSADYAREGWRVRLLGAESVPDLRATADYLRTVTPVQSAHTLYWTVTPDADSPWQQLFAATHGVQISTRAEAILALYGEEIPPATLYLAFGKPTISLDLIPPLLIGQLQCYWSQQPGYTLSEVQLRTVLYDYAYLRPTWRAEKLERAQDALVHRQAWEEGPWLGLGMRLGPFWYPAPMSSPAWPPEQNP
jgi:hypothetical protein